MRIKIHKRSEVAGGLPARDPQDHIDGQAQPEAFSLPIEYTAEGDLLHGIHIGEPVIIARDIRNGIMCLGLLETSCVTEVTETTFHTKNSVYDYFLLTPDALPVS